MTKVLLIQGKDPYTYRLEQSMKMCKVQYKTVQSYIDIPFGKWDITFVDPSVSYDPTNKINSTHTIFFDTDDSPEYFCSGVAYESMKDKVQFYAKMNWVEDDRGDGIQNIGFPLSIYMFLEQFSYMDLAPFNYNNAIPIFFGTGTFLEDYTPIENTIYNSDSKLEIFPLRKISNGEYIYNQRLDWLLSLRENNVPHIGGLVFKDKSLSKNGKIEVNLSEQWQSKHFGKGITKFKVPFIAHNKYLEHLFTYRIGLCPSGRDRLSWRMFDIMATGAILIQTDIKKQKSLYMPKEFVTIKDGEDLGKILFNLHPDFKELWKASQTNREIFRNLTPEKIWKDFTNQLQ